MDIIIDKKSKHSFGGWSTRLYRLQGCELLQYEKGVKSAAKAIDKAIKKRYNVKDISSISIGQGTPYILSVSIGEEKELFWKFDDVDKKKVNHIYFTAFYRIIIASSKISNSSQCKFRAIPSNICYALYYLLQQLYKHTNILKTPYIFDMTLLNSSNDAEIKQLFYNLLVHGRKYANEKNEYDDIHLLAMTLKYTLSNMPTSLFCDSLCRSLTNVVISVIFKCEQDTKEKDKNWKEKIKELPEFMDADIYFVERMKKAYLPNITEFLTLKYVENKKKCLRENGFHLSNRYAFLHILFSLLGKICCAEHYPQTKMSADKLAHVFAAELQSKRYLYDGNKDENYERNFIQMIKILIYFAKDIFPDDLVWKVRQLVVCQGKERRMVQKYNDNFSRDVKNKFFMRPVLKFKKEYGQFDDEILVPKKEKYEEKETRLRSKASSEKFLHRQESQPFVIKKKVSHALEPTQPSDIGMSDDTSAMSDVDDEKIVKDLEIIEEKKPHKVVVNDEDYSENIGQNVFDDDIDDGYVQDDEEKQMFDTGTNGMNGYQQHGNYKQWQTQNVDNEIANDYGYNANNDRSGLSSWFMDWECDLNFCAPFKNLFNGQRNTNDPQQYATNEMYNGNQQYTYQNEIGANDNGHSPMYQGSNGYVPQTRYPGYGHTSP